MTNKEVIKRGMSIGLVIKQCHNPEYLAIDCGEALDPNERMRITSDGKVLMVNGGRYWQVGSAEDIAEEVMVKLKWREQNEQ